MIKDAQNNQNWNLNLQLGVFFCHGVCLYYFRSFFATHTKSILLVLGTIRGILFSVDQEYTALFLLLPPLAILFGSASTPCIRDTGRYGDISYGVYLYAFPVQQTIISLFGNHLTIWSALSLSTAVTVALAFLSWHLVESPALQLKKRYFVKSKEIEPCHQAKKVRYHSNACRPAPVRLPTHRLCPAIDMRFLQDRILIKAARPILRTIPRHGSLYSPLTKHRMHLITKPTGHPYEDDTHTASCLTHRIKTQE